MIRIARPTTCPPLRARRPRRHGPRLLATGLALLVPVACSATSGTPAPQPSASRAASSGAPAPAPSGPPRGTAGGTPEGPATTSPTTSSTAGGAVTGPPRFTMAFAGDVHFSGRIAPRLARDPATVFAQAAAGLRRADLTMVNLETAITTGGVPQAKEFHFRAPGSAFTALRDAGVDVATMANNHGADYGLSGLRDSLRAIRRHRFPVVGIGRDAAAAFAPYRTRLHGQPVAVIAADQVHDETTLSLFSAGRHSPGVANADEGRLEAAVRRAHRAGDMVVVYVHWGIEYDTCPSADQTALASRLARAGADAVIGTHAHVLQGAGWLPDGTYVAYGLGNYLWWESFGNLQDDNGVLTLHVTGHRVTGARFAPSHLDARGVPVPATGAERDRILAEWRHDRACTDLSARPPR